MGTTDYFTDELRARIAHYRELLEPLEAGVCRVGIRYADEPWRDTTQGQIDYLKRTISDYQSVVDRRDNA
jgi:hypothetical protein